MVKVREKEIRFQAIDNITKVYPKEGFFADYYELGKGSEICPRFHFFVSACILGAVVNRKVFFQRGSAETFPTLYPNPWIILVAPQGEGHKSSAMGIGYKLLMKLEEQNQPNILADKTTPEQLVACLASEEPKARLKRKPPPGTPENFFRDDALGLLYASELGVFLGKEKYNSGLIALLTTLYDCPEEWSSGTVGRGNQRLHNVCLSFLAASTPDWMQTMLPGDTFRGGFMSRLILITKPYTWNLRISDPAIPPEGLYQRLIDELNEMSQIEGQMKWTPEAKKFFDDWYVDLGRRDIAPGPVLAYLERKQDHLLRFAVLLQLTYTKGELMLQKETIEQALTIMDTVEQETSAIIEFVATEPGMRSVQNILEHLRRHGKLGENHLLRLVWRSLRTPREFSDAIDILLKSKEIKIQTINGGLGYEYVPEGKRRK